MKASKSKTVGILAFQGGVIEHQKIIEKLGHNVILVKAPKDLQSCDALIIPGGESTTIGFFLEESGLAATIKKRAKAGLPIWGTCAGAILLAKEIKSDIIPPHLNLMDITVQRNAYGRQLDSFYADLKIEKLKIKNLKTAFIRAPIIKKTSSNAEILAEHEGQPVLVRQNKLLASTFHPELRGDSSLHQYFCSLI